MAFGKYPSQLHFTQNIGSQWQKLTLYSQRSNGDSGGPVIQYAGDQPILIGVASASVQCTSSGYPDVSVRVSAHTEWITGLATNAVVHTGKVKQIVRHCRRGFILFSTNRAPARCVECAKDEVSIGGAARVCYQCVRNSLRDPGNGSTCSCVAAVGRGFSTNGGGSCVLCPRGRFSGVGDGNCRPCKEGSFASTRGSEKCLPCEGAPKGASRCDG